MLMYIGEMSPAAFELVYLKHGHKNSMKGT